MKLIILFFVLATNAFASIDYKVTARSRNYPTSLVSEFDVGYNVLLWGDSQKILYGYLRPNFIFSEIGTFHSGSAALDFYPISFFKLRGGASIIKTNSRRTDINCNEFDCQGTIRTKFFESSLLLGAGDYFSALKYRINSSDRRDGDKSFLEFDTMIPMHSRHDQSQFFQMAIGKTINEKWSGLFASGVASSKDAHGSSTSHYLLGMWSQDNIEIAGGPGIFRSSLQEKGFSAVLWITWNGRESLALKKRR
ncbi:MAG: hypothetical protein WC635_03020 [Bacteriovorax sp.]|jgi:hypothetical protein